MEIEDILGKPMKGIEVFAAAIRYIREHLLSVLNDPNREDHVKITSDNDIRWVLTVPAIWNDLSKRFMREAAVQVNRKFHLIRLRDTCVYTNFSAITMISYDFMFM